MSDDTYASGSEFIKWCGPYRTPEFFSHTLRCTVKPISRYADRIAHPQFLPPVWVVMPQPYDPSVATVPVWGLGRRELWLPQGSAICATWWEAMEYATTGRQHRPVAMVHPGWCGV